MFSKQFTTIPHSKDLFFRGHSLAFNRVFFHTFRWKSNLEWCGGWNNGVVGSWTTWFLDFNKRGAWNKHGGAKFESLLINVVAEITELWVGKSQKINCRDVTFIREGRVHVFIYKQPSCQGPNVKNGLKVNQLAKQPPTLKS